MRYAIITLGLLAGIALTLFSLKPLYDSSQARTWPTSAGNIVSADIKVSKIRQKDSDSTGGKKVPVYHPVVTYTYRVKEQDYIGASVSYHQNSSREKESVLAFLAHYPVGKNVSVRYSPDNPGRSVLIPEGEANYILLYLGFLVSAVFTWLLKRNLQIR